MLVREWVRGARVRHLGFLLGALAWGAVLLGTGGCKNPFATREPEEPAGLRSRWIPPSQPQDVLENLRNAIAEEHVPNYLKCFSDSSETGIPFLFTAEPGVVTNYPDLFAYWSLMNEQRYVDQLFQATPADSLRRLVFGDLTERVGEENQRLLIGEYTLEVHHTLVGEGVPQLVRGRAEFVLIRNERDSYWYISQWRDNATGSEPTWSVLKAAFGR